MSLAAPIITAYSYFLASPLVEFSVLKSFFGKLVRNLTFFDSRAFAAIEALDFHCQNPPFTVSNTLLGFLEEVTLEDSFSPPALFVRGWLLHKSKRILSLCLRTEDGSFALVDYGVQRADLASIFWWNHHSKSAGFHGRIFLNSNNFDSKDALISIVTETVNGERIHSEFIRTDLTKREALEAAPQSDAA